jgi:hypothetical protein
VINMIADLFIKAEADYRTERLLREAEVYRLARHVPSRASRARLRGGESRAFVINARTPRWAVATCARRIRWALRGLT